MRGNDISFALGAQVDVACALGLHEADRQGTLAPMESFAIIERAVRTNPLLVATDFDGTIADITPRPADACLRSDARAVLSALALVPGVFVAVVSGRDMETLRRLTSGLGPVYRVAEHGAFMEAPEGTAIETHAVVPQETIEHLGQIASDLVRHVPGMIVEHKTSSVTVHVREVDPAQRAHALALLDSFRFEASRAGMVVMEGRLIVEARSARASKRAALELLLGRLSSQTFVMYAGDDTTDEGAIELAKVRGGAGIYVASAERPRPSVEVDLVVSTPREWIEMLEALVAARGVTSR